jgi:hypothetical protein
VTVIVEPQASPSDGAACCTAVQAAAPLAAALLTDATRAPARTASVSSSEWL